MSPRSTEFLDAAHGRLAMARRGLGIAPASDADAEAIVALAARFIAAVEAMFA
jgi:hypothetical protein